MVRLEAVRIAVICMSDWFLSGLSERPFQKELMTEVLSQWTFIEKSCKPLDVSHMTAISIATDSSQPMSLTANCQPPISFHEAHLSFIMSPIPHEVDESTHTSR